MEPIGSLRSRIKWTLTGRPLGWYYRPLFLFFWSIITQQWPRNQLLGPGKEDSNMCFFEMTGGSYAHFWPIWRLENVVNILQYIASFWNIMCIEKTVLLMGARNEILSLSSRLAGFLSSSLLSRIVRWCCAFRVEHDCKLRTGELRGGHVFLTHGRQYFTTSFKLFVVQCWSDCIKMKSDEVLTSSVGCSFSFPHNRVGVCYKYWLRQFETVSDVCQHNGNWGGHGAAEGPCGSHFGEGGHLGQDKSAAQVPQTMALQGWFFNS